ncbi:polycomb protein Pcl [Agrilus planipennis]|uniref:Polycomb protein Pcl n=1 Tax=Agrilus planipennis TaxID=224129 RepID=A0A1W4X6U3_AGRPL|nr:polycomb protein Pcl [Agrilus planipennis]
MTSTVTSAALQNTRSKRSLVETEEAAVPDSTTSVEKERVGFSPGQDVLLKHKDGRYYLGTVVEVDSIREQCLVKFGDNTENWSSVKDLTKLSTPEQEDLLCVVCKKSAPKDKHEISVCDKCGRGYHQRCHQPEIPTICLKEGTSWMCRRCMESEPHRQRRNAEYKQLRKDSIRKICSGIDNSTSSLLPTSFPYDPYALNWDAYHRVNMEQIYCYCGQNGEWYTQMLQCGRCRQWFHEKCVRCLQYPLYCGDRFYVFVCAICNYGKEFLRRLELKWVDLVHLMVFNLTAYHSKKYYDLDTVIIPYINDNWHALQLPPKIYNVSKVERRENILSVLTNNRIRFKCGREIKKRTTIWGLRVRLPPPAPCVTLPPTGPVCEQELRERWQGNRKLQFLPLFKANDTKMIIPVDNHMLNIMMGTAYQESSALSETESPCPSPDADLAEENRLEMNSKLYIKNEFHGAGCAKKSVPFPKISLQRRKQFLNSMNREREKLLRKQKAKPPEVKEEQDKTAILPPTPPTSVSAPPTPPSVIQDQAEKLVDPTNSLEFPNTPCDTSGDETSSKSTLDLIIPPPKDFKGKNNPFLTLLRGTGDDGSAFRGKKRRSKDAITLPLPLTAVIPGTPVIRPMKRQLSEKDICIGPNGEVKRRRLRRGRVGQMAMYTATGQPTASKTATVVPARPDQRSLRSSLQQQTTTNTSSSSQISSCVDYALNGRRLRQRQDKNEKEKVPSSTSSNPPTPKPSPVKQEPDIDMDDLKSSVNIYFGAANRIAAGERFAVKAKRVGPCGRIQYLIEWEGPSNGMT